MRSRARLVTFVLAAFAFAAAWLVPRAAGATILPACELREQLSLGPTAPAVPALSAADGSAWSLLANEANADISLDPDAVSATAPDCDELTDVPGLAPMCDARGATTIAPPRIFPVDGGTIEMKRTCSTLDLAPSSIDEARSGARLLVTGSGIVAVLHDAAPTLGPVAFPALMAAFPPLGGGPLAGVRRGIEHPPR